MSIKRTITACAMSACFLLLAAQSALAAKKPNIVEIAASNESFSTLVAAVQAADLVETLSGEGAFTVFAPTNAAFEALPEGTLESLLKPENKAVLASILTYHVVPTKVPAAQVKTMKVEMANGQSAQLEVSGKGVLINDARVIQTDIMASNGVIHIIDSVILPEVAIN